MGLNVQGLLVSGVDKNGPAAAADVQRGMLITSIDGQNTASLVAAAKRLYAKAKGERMQMEVIWPRQRGAFIEYRQGTVELILR